MDSNGTHFTQWYNEREPYLMNQIQFGFCDATRDDRSATVLMEWMYEAYCAGIRAATSDK